MLSKTYPTICTDYYAKYENKPFGPNKLPLQRNTNKPAI